MSKYYYVSNVVNGEYRYNAMVSGIYESEDDKLTEDMLDNIRSHIVNTHGLPFYISVNNIFIINVIKLQG